MSVMVTGLTKRFSANGPPVVADVSFEAPTGSITALIGPSGAGKSTVLRLIAGLESPDAGSIVVEGEEYTAVPVQRRGVGFVFQSYALFRNMTVCENVAFGLKIRKRPSDQIASRVDELLRLVGLSDFSNRYPAQLSGGQRQRVAFARALAIEPKVLLLDEPFGALDARVRSELRDWLRDMHEQTKVTTILVTHDQEEALEVAEHVVIMFAGKVAQAGAPSDVYDEPAGAEVAEFLGASMLNAQVRTGRAEVGSFAVAAPETAKDGDVVRAWVRPHDVKLARTCDGHANMTRGRIVKAKILGDHVKASLLVGHGNEIVVKVPRAEFSALGVREGDEVLVDLRSARVFLEDYAI